MPCLPRRHRCRTGHGRGRGQPAQCRCTRRSVRRRAGERGRGGATGDSGFRADACDGGVSGCGGDVHAKPGASRSLAQWISFGALGGRHELAHNPGRCGGRGGRLAARRASLLGGCRLLTDLQPGRRRRLRSHGHAERQPRRRRAEWQPHCQLLGWQPLWDARWRHAARARGGAAGRSPGQGNNSSACPTAVATICCCRSAWWWDTAAAERWKRGMGAWGRDAAPAWHAGSARCLISRGRGAARARGRRPLLHVHSSSAAADSDSAGGGIGTAGCRCRCCRVCPWLLITIRRGIRAPAFCTQTIG
mmetsp:Transcript_74985/g.243687  ORF Transcript_74985/g.243687 Transcript_74985/m.243687 type:complete len:305 (+) Transcript_74985:1744-2658(+)